MTNHPAFLWTRWLPSRVVNAAATLGPVGLWGKAPGTNGSVVGILLYTALFYNLGFVGEILLTLFLLYLAIAFCGEAELRMQKRDPGEIILDEVVAVPICFLGLSETMRATGHMWVYMVAGFILFRIFDIAKPFGIKKLQFLKAGLGVVADDVAAAVATAVVMRVAIVLLTLSGWLPAPGA